MSRTRVAAAFLMSCALLGAQGSIARADSCVLEPPYVGGPPEPVCHRTVSVGPQLDPFAGVTYGAGTIVPVSGQGVVAGDQVEVDGQWSPIVANADGGLGFALPSAARAGIDVARLGVGEPPVPLKTARPQRLMVRPVVTRATFAAGEVRIAVMPSVEAGQTATLALSSADGPGASVQVSVAPDLATSDLSFSLPAGFPSGNYLATVAVDKISSLPRVDPAGEPSPQVQVP
jgi:hypothetical protein